MVDMFLVEVYTKTIIRYMAKCRSEVDERNPGNHESLS